jgi:ligand-binding sensor domain-containing protein/signal transduction histidine kinase
LKNSNTCREFHVAEGGLLTACLAVMAGLCFVGRAQAIDPSRFISQYIRDYWGTEKGFNGGAIAAFAQTPDGYLWIGTEKGLIRFDGLAFRLFQQATPAAFPIGAVQALQADKQGNLWVLLQSTKVLRYHDGEFDLGNEEAEFGITALGSRTDGSILLSSLTLGTLTYRAGKFEPLFRNESSKPPSSAGSAYDLSSRLSWATGVTPHRFAEPNSAVISITETADGRIWLGTRDKGLFYEKDAQVIPAPKSPPNSKINCLRALDNRELLIGTDKGIFRWNGAEVTSQGVPAALRHTRALSMIRDHDANIWVGTPAGLIRIRVDHSLLSVSESDSRTIGSADALFEDREGNLWLGSSSGLERLRDSAFLAYSMPDLQSESTGPVYADSSGRIWFAPIEGGLRWFKSGGSTATIAANGLAQDVVYSISGSNNGLWLGRQHGGLTRLQLSAAGITTRTYTTADRLAQNTVYTVFQSRDGGVWAGTLSGGVTEFRNGRFKTYTAADGLAANTISAIAESPDHTMWFATPSGLSAFSDGHWRTFRVADGLPSNNVNCLFADDENGALWIGTATGIAILQAGHLQAPVPVPSVLREQILGIAKDKHGWLWISTSNHVLRVNSNKLLAGAVTDEGIHMYGQEDGLRGTEGVKRFQSVIADSSGKIWFSMNRGLSVVDPSRASNLSAPALVHIEGFSSDGNPVTANDHLRLPDAPRRITFNYAALSLSVPERVRYKYKLEGLDENWSDPVTAREVTYNNLSSGSYRFRVIASNSDGLWNSEELVVPFEIEPAYWRTWWFRLSAVILLALAMLLFFRLRVARLTRQMNMRFEERLAERTRIAQELHDTLLQGFLSASMQLHVADDHLDSESPAKPFVGRVLNLMGRVIDEGRNAVRGLRLADQQSQNLEQAFSGIQQEMEVWRASGFRVFAGGEPRPVRPVIRETVYRIGREAIINAFRHAKATKIEVELQYAASHLRLLVRDNGVGMDQQVVRGGRDGHWGLSGMRERADGIAAKLRVLSSHAAGTEIELSVPGRIAFESLHSNNRWGWLSKLKLRMAGEREPDVESEKHK